MSYNEQMQKIWKMFTQEHDKEPVTINECFQWAKEKGLWHPKPLDVEKIFQKEMANALRKEMRTDPSGREYRAMQSVKTLRGGVQLNLWQDTDLASRNFMEKAVQQRRKGLVDTGHKIKRDVDHVNEYRFQDDPIQLVLDITEDIEEREALEEISKELKAKKQEKG